MEDSFRWFNDKEKEGRFFFEYTNTEDEMIAAIAEDIRYCLLETPTNPLMIEFDIEKVAQTAHEKGAVVIVDNTFYSPIYQTRLLKVLISLYIQLLNTYQGIMMF